MNVEGKRERLIQEKLLDVKRKAMNTASFPKKKTGLTKEDSQKVQSSRTDGSNEK